MHYNGGILNGCQQAQTDHAILLVGYGYWGKRPYWKVKNSWATTWGLEGFGLLARNVGGSGSCSILSGTNGVVVYGPYNPQAKFRGSDGRIIEDRAKVGAMTTPITI